MSWKNTTHLKCYDFFCCILSFQFPRPWKEVSMNNGFNVWITLLGTNTSHIFASYFTICICEHLRLCMPATKKSKLRNLFSIMWIHTPPTQPVQLLKQHSSKPWPLSWWLIAWWLWQLLVNCCFKSRMLDQVYFAKYTLPDEFIFLWAAGNFSITYLYGNIQLQCYSVPWTTLNGCRICKQHIEKG